MTQLSEKELSVLNDSLSEEELLVKKFSMLAQHAQDQEVKEKFTKVSEQHQGHLNELYSLLGQGENDMNMNEKSQFTDKEVLGDGLAAVKAATSNYNMFSNECAHENVRNCMMDLLKKEHEIQDDIFHMMSAKGYYPTPAAEEKKIAEAKQKYSQCVK